MRRGSDGDCGRGQRASRRALLGGVGSLAFALGVAGCGEVTSYEFRADRVGLPTDARTSLGYDAEDRTSIVTEESREVGGTTVDATIESHLAVYESTPRSDADPPLPTVAVVSTPSAAVGGQSLNPLATTSLADLLTGEHAAWFLQDAGLDIEDPDSGVPWERDPERLATRQGTCLGEAVTVETYAGVVATETQPVVFVHLTRADAESVVLTGAVQRRSRRGEDAPYVGPDGAMSADALDDAGSSFVATLDELTVTGG